MTSPAFAELTAFTSSSPAAAASPSLRTVTVPAAAEPTAARAATAAASATADLAPKRRSSSCDAAPRAEGGAHLRLLPVRALTCSLASRTLLLVVRLEAG